MHILGVVVRARFRERSSTAPYSNWNTTVFVYDMRMNERLSSTVQCIHYGPIGHSPIGINISAAYKPFKLVQCSSHTVALSM